MACEDQCMLAICNNLKSPNDMVAGIERQDKGKAVKTQDELLIPRRVQ